RAHATSPHRTTGDPVGHLVFLHASAIERFLPPSARPSDHSPDWSGLGKEFPETIRALNPRTAKLPESSPSPPLEERVGERRPYLPHSDLDFYCPLARLSVELDGFAHGLPQQVAGDIAREKFLLAHGIEELRFWNHQWRQNREGVLLEIWHVLQRRTGCTQVMRKLGNQTSVPPALKQLGK